MTRFISTRPILTRRESGSIMGMRESRLHVISALDRPAKWRELADDPLNVTSDVSSNETDQIKSKVRKIMTETTG